MVTKRRIKNALTALTSGDLSEAVKLAGEAVRDDLPMVNEAMQAAFALGQADAKGEPGSPEAMGFLRLLTEGVGAEGFRTLRAEAGISQAEIAEMCGVSRAAVSDWERGKATLPPSAMHALFGLVLARFDKAKPAPLYGRDIARIRKGLGMRQADFAAALGISEIAVRKWERLSDKPLAPSTVRRIQPRLEELEAGISTAS